MVEVSERIVVGFAGEGSGVDDLSWGQQEIWMSMVRQRTWNPIGGWSRLRPGATVADIAAELSYLVGRYQSMRTRLRFTADGRPQQVVSTHGEVVLDIVDAADDADAEEIAEEVDRWYKAGSYDFVTEWPVRMAVIRQHGQAACQVTVVCHLVTDGLGAVTMINEVARRESGPVTATQPLEQTRWQRSPAGRRQHDAAMRHWERILRAIPAPPRNGPADPRQPRYWELKFRSPAMYPAVRSIGERTRSDSAAVLLALFAVARGRLTGMSPVVVRPIVSNRFRPGLAEVVSPVNQAGLCAVEVAGTVDEVVDRTRRAAMTAYKYAYYDPAALAELIATVERDRGARFDWCFFNDRRVGGRGADGPAPDAGRVRELLADSTFNWVFARERPSDPLFLNIDDASDVVAMTLDFDTHHVSPADAEACVRTMEEVAVRAAFDPAVPTGLPAVATR